MRLEIFLSLLFAVSILVGLTVEALKSLLGDKKYSSNILAGIVSVALSIIVGACYCVLYNVYPTPQIIIYLFALVFLSWLCAMLGYDKVIQAIKQIKGGA